MSYRDRQYYYGVDYNNIGVEHLSPFPDFRICNMGMGLEMKLYIKLWLIEVVSCIPV
jgi:hypothetical protein